MLVLFRCFVVSDRVKAYINSSGTATEKKNTAAFPRVSCWVVQLRSMTSLGIRWLTATLGATAHLPISASRTFHLPEYSFWIGSRQLPPKVDKRLLEISTLY
jgi:hypothetical protein